MAGTSKPCSDWHRRARPSRPRSSRAPAARFERSPRGSAQLRYALLLATPGHPARDLLMAQTLLRQLAASPRHWCRSSARVVLIELSQIDRELDLKSRQRSLTADDAAHGSASASLPPAASANRDGRERQLRKELEEAQAKLDAIANIERNLTERKTAPEGASAVNQTGQTQSPHPRGRRRSGAAAPADHPPARRELRRRGGGERVRWRSPPRARFRPDLVISDLRMDQLDGIGLLKELQNRWPGPQGHHADRPRHDSRCRAGDANGRLRLSHQAGREAGAARSGAKGAAGSRASSIRSGLARRDRDPQSP